MRDQRITESTVRWMWQLISPMRLRSDVISNAGWNVCLSTRTFVKMRNSHTCTMSLVFGSGYRLQQPPNSHLWGTWAKVASEPPPETTNLLFISTAPSIHGQVILHQRPPDPGVWAQDCLTRLPSQEQVWSNLTYQGMVHMLMPPDWCQQWATCVWCGWAAQGCP